MKTPAKQYIMMHTKSDSGSVSEGSNPSPAALKNVAFAGKMLEARKSRDLRDAAFDSYPTPGCVVSSYTDLALSLDLPRT